MTTPEALAAGKGEGRRLVPPPNAPPNIPDASHDMPTNNKREKGDWITESLPKTAVNSAGSH